MKTKEKESVPVWNWLLLDAENYMGYCALSVEFDFYADHSIAAAAVVAYADVGGVVARYEIKAFTGSATCQQKS